MNTNDNDLKAFDLIMFLVGAIGDLSAENRLLRHVADTDDRTNVLRPTAWEVQATLRAERLRADKDLCAVLIVDVDRFKAVNDMYGHAAGDIVLAAVAEAIRAEVRAADLVGRPGGDEFSVFLDSVSCVDDVMAVADRIRGRVEELHYWVPVVDGPPAVMTQAVTVSIGAAMCSAQTGGLPTSRLAADTALYRAKSAGRNKARMTRGGNRVRLAEAFPWEIGE